MIIAFNLTRNHQISLLCINIVFFLFPHFTIDYSRISCPLQTYTIFKRLYCPEKQIEIVKIVHIFKTERNGGASIHLKIFPVSNAREMLPN